MAVLLNIEDFLEVKSKHRFFSFINSSKNYFGYSRNEYILLQPYSVYSEDYGN